MIGAGNPLEISMPKGSGNVVAQALRRVAMTTVPTWAPIGFSFSGLQMNQLHVDSMIIEDTTSILSNLSDLEVIPLRDIDENLKLMKISFRGELTANEMKDSDFMFIGTNNDPLVSAIDKTKTFTMNILLRRGIGGYEVRENQSVDTSSLSLPPEKFIFMSSRHSEVSDFLYDVLDGGLREDRIAIRLSSKSKKPKEVLLYATEALEQMLKTFKENVNKLPD